MHVSLTYVVLRGKKLSIEKLSSFSRIALLYR
jgi:hypothetical protein